MAAITHKPSRTRYGRNDTIRTTCTCGWASSRDTDRAEAERELAIHFGDVLYTMAGTDTGLGNVTITEPT